MSFPEPTSFNGAPTRDDDPGSLGRGEPERWKCLDCPAGGRGYVKRAKHWYSTGQGHRIVWANDPRAKSAPRESIDPKPDTQCLTADGEGRR